MAKYRYYKTVLDPGVSLTVPDQSFTPREIIEQFASGEIVAQQHEATDEFYDDKMSDDDLIDRVVDINDDFVGRQLVIDYMIEQDETKASNNVRRGSSQAAADPVDGVSGAASVEGSPQSEPAGSSAS